MNLLFRHLKSYWWLHLAGLISATIYTSLSHRSLQIDPVPLHYFFICWSAVWVLLLATLLTAWKKKVKIPFFAIIIWTVVFRITGIVAIPMLSEDDYFRFLWDGYRFAETGNPYGEIPADFFDDSNISEPMSEIVYDINYPHLPTIYGPVMEVIFWISYQIAPGSLIALKILFTLFEGLLLYLLSRTLNSRWFLFAAWCPLLIFESSFQAHPDLIGVSLMFLAFFAAKKGNPWLAMIFLGLASSAKVFAVLLWPFIVQKDRWFRQGVFMAGVILMIYLPFIGQQSDAGSTSLQAMATGWEFNPAIYVLLKQFTESYARILSLGSFALIYLILVIQFWKKNIKQTETSPPLDLVFGAFLILSPVINPWYLLWLLPFSLTTPRYWSLTAVFIVSISYATGLNLESESLADFQIPIHIQIIEFGLITLAIGIDRYCSIKRARELPLTNAGT